MIFFELDLSGAEWHVVAYLANDPKMIEVSKSGQSPHGITGNLISLAPIELIMEEDKKLGHMTDPNELEEGRKNIPGLLDGEYFLPRTMTIRQAGKKSNHGLNYDMKYRRFALENEMPEPDAKRICWLYINEAYPGIPKWWERTRNELRENNRTLDNCLGRKVRLLDEWGTTLFDKAYSFRPQSTVVDCVNDAMHKAYHDERSHFERAVLSAQVHDSLLYGYPTDDIASMWAFLHDMREYMRPVLHYNGHDFQLKVDIKVGYSWGAMESVDIDANDGPEILGDQVQRLTKHVL